VPGQDERARRRVAAALALPYPPLRDETVALRPWRTDDVPDRQARLRGDEISFALVGYWLAARARGRGVATSEGVLRPHMAFNGGRRDAVMSSLLPRELLQ
jgi:hypothetical protein